MAYRAEDLGAPCSAAVAAWLARPPTPAALVTAAVAGVEARPVVRSVGPRLRLGPQSWPPFLERRMWRLGQPLARLVCSSVRACAGGPRVPCARSATDAPSTSISLAPICGA